MTHARLEGLNLDILRNRKSEKWNTYPPEILPAWVAEMDFPLAEPIREYLEQATGEGDVGYPIDPTTTGVREAFSKRMKEHFEWPIDPHQVEILSEVVQGIYLGLMAFARPGTGAVVQTPIYPPFLHALKDTGVRLAENQLQPKASGWEIDFDQLNELAKEPLSVFLLCNPQNPTGRAYGRTELEKLAEFALRNNLIVISDEIHADLVFDERKHIPFASLSPEVSALTVTLNSASKSFNIPGLRCAVAHFGDPAVQKRFAETTPRHSRGGLGILGIYASVVAWQEGDPWLHEVREHLQSNRDHLCEQLAARIPSVRILSPEATYLAWLDCSDLKLQPSPARFFLKHGQVALSEGKNFGEDFGDFVRVNFATSRKILDDVIDRMVAALNASG